MGKCLPKGCKQYHYDIYIASTLKTINGFLDKLDNYYHHPKMNGTFVRYWTRIGLSMIKTNEYNDNWWRRTAGGVVPTCVIFGLIILVALTGNFIEYYNHKK
jgi:hypothetical protein